MNRFFNSRKLFFSGVPAVPVKVPAVPATVPVTRNAGTRFGVEIGVYFYRRSSSSTIFLFSR